MTFRHVGDGLYATPTGQFLLVWDDHPDSAERGWTVLEVISDSPTPDDTYGLGVEATPVGPIFRTRTEAAAWLARN
jgi:hypothetical protein